MPAGGSPLNVRLWKNRLRRQFLDGLVDGENFDSSMFMNHLFSSSKYKGASN